MKAALLPSCTASLCSMCGNKTAFSTPRGEEKQLCCSTRSRAESTQKNPLYIILPMLPHIPPRKKSNAHHPSNIDSGGSCASLRPPGLACRANGMQELARMGCNSTELLMLYACQHISKHTSFLAPLKTRCPVLRQGLALQTQKRQPSDEVENQCQHSASGSVWSLMFCSSLGWVSMRRIKKLHC